MTAEQQVHEIVIVGGGAGGLELATRLGDKLGKKKRANITLIDASPSHLWKPLLYEVAAGSLDSYAERLEYLAQGHWHHFRFRLGRMDGLNRVRQEISVAPTLDDEGVEIIPRRSFHYDTLIIAVGSVGNDFGVPGVKEHCIMLDTPEQAREFHRHHINACLRAHTQTAAVTPGQVTVGIVGAGATGVELAAELHDTTRELSAYGLEKIDPDKSLKLLIVEASDRILPGLPPRLSAAAAERLAELGVEVHTNERVVEVRRDGMLTADGKFIPASMMVWSAGIKAPDFLKDLDGLETNRINQLVVRPTLQTTRDDNIFALGDCAACPMPNGSNVPPRAQAAHQQASLMAKAICRRFRGKPLLEYVYRDYGSLVALGRFSTVGNLMGALTGGSIMIEGTMARLVYWSLHKMHEIALHGWFKTALTTYAHFISTPTRARIKLH
ncbi:NAD(P)/FAD-dependent oxidoreductase [Thiobacillus denitrificans]|uniref:Pyridine nucleotide-disulfide oxidoreductase n=1 Tax=Thiobacillus denitrificans TaxID=36861 RepID=A0A125BC73_THIDE|nr:NAD(P)/FAD-dependent oxidoreductase [Thiobacillus denitrificans]KVW94623.1 pyridine nucleotide-disulfide oxidoreductase [Thiobacillus denitrificans]